MIMLAIPDFGGETDVLKACSLLPGIHSGDNGMGGLHVRGGDTDQNLVCWTESLFTQFRSHIHLFSIFNNEIVQNTRVLRWIPFRIWRSHQFCDGR
ncbi:MAG: hypothetical protein R2784_06640 [Saprospiraceae bacterium]